MEIRAIAHIKTQLKEKFGIPRQAGLVPGLTGTIVFNKEFRNPDAIRGLEGFDRIWLIWEFSANKRESWSPTVRPPRLGGNKRMGVFATRSPFRPNNLGLSCVKLEGMQLQSSDGPLLFVSGADLMDGTPIYDIKPYIPYADSYPDAKEGFAGKPETKLECSIPPELSHKLGAEELRTLTEILEADPRPAYHNDPKREYGLVFSDFNIKFIVNKNTIYVNSIEKEYKNGN